MFKWIDMFNYKQKFSAALSNMITENSFHSGASGKLSQHTTTQHGIITILNSHVVIWVPYPT